MTLHLSRASYVLDSFDLNLACVAYSVFARTHIDASMSWVRAARFDKDRQCRNSVQFTVSCGTAAIAQQQQAVEEAK